MALFDEDPIAITVMHVRHAARVAHNTVASSLDSIKAFVWSNPYGLTPQQVMDALGKDAAEIDIYVKPLVMCRDAVNDSKQETWIPADKTIKANVDGTVTISEKLAEK